MINDLISCGWFSFLGALNSAEHSRPGIMGWLFCCAIGAGVIAGIAALLGFLFSDEGKEKENAKAVGGITFVLLMVLAFIVY